MKILTTFLFTICLCILGCSDKENLSQGNLIGGWYFIEGDSYYELHFNKNHMLLHNELTGSKINEYNLSNDNVIQVLKNDKVVEEYKIDNLSDDKGIITMQGRTIEIQHLDAQLDISKILEGKDKAYKNFESQFNQRQSKYLDQMVL